MSVTISIFKNVVKDIMQNDYTGLASEMAYNFILAIFPFIIFLVAILGLLGTHDAINQLISSIATFAPSGVIEMIRNILHQTIDSSSGGLATLGLVGSLWAAAGGVKVIMKAINKAYDVKETRSFLKSNGLAILIVFLLIFVLFIASNITIFLKIILDFLSRLFYIPDNIFSTVFLARWPVTFLAIFAISLIIYYFTPNIYSSIRVRFLSSIPGAVFFCVFWILASWVFSFYVENFARYNAVYGTLGGGIILLIWLYYTSLIILIGGEINSQVYKYIEPKVIELHTR